MVGELITFPLRVGVRATQLCLRATEEVVAVAAGAAGRLIDQALPSPPTPQPGSARPAAETELAPELFEPQRDAFERDSERAEAERPSAAEAEHASEAEAEHPSEAGGPPELPSEPDTAPEPSAESEPTHVSEEPVLVEQVAEPGAEDGAGASVHVEEPWNGYAHMKADDVIAKLSGATPAELAAVQLYEQAGKGRVTVLEAVERELRISSRSGSHS